MMTFKSGAINKLFKLGIFVWDKYGALCHTTDAHYSQIFMQDKVHGPRIWDNNTRQWRNWNNKETTIIRAYIQDRQK